MTKIVAPAAFMAALVLTPLFVQAAGTPDVPANPSLQEVVNGSWRTPAFVKRDQYRHPLKVLEFFGIRPDMTVIELDPGGGWWTEMLAPYLKAHGHLVDTLPPADSQGFEKRAREGFLAKLQGNPGLYSKVSTVPFAPPQTVKLGPPDSADMVLTFRNLHDMVNAHVAETVLKAAYAVLKPGGVLGISDHRAWPSANGPQVAKEYHRITEDYALQLVLDAGFRLAGVSEVNANPKDPLNISVFHLPPTLAGDTPEQKQKYTAIGESDVFVMKFIKP